jgi:hypothetical protein
MSLSNHVRGIQLLNGGSDRHAPRRPIDFRHVIHAIGAFEHDAIARFRLLRHAGLIAQPQRACILRFSEFRQSSVFPQGSSHYDDAKSMGRFTAAIVLEERSPYGPGTNDNRPDSVRSKDEIDEYLQSSLAYARKAMSSLTIKNHLDPVKTYFGPMAKADVAAGVAYHSFDHYGQMVVYARINGVIPPSSQPQAPAQ